MKIEKRTRMKSATISFHERDEEKKMDLRDEITDRTWNSGREKMKHLELRIYSS